MSTKMGIWRWALASAAMVILCGTASARIINDPPSVTTNESAAVVIYPNLQVNTNNCLGGVCNLTPTKDCTSDSDCVVNTCDHTVGACTLTPDVACSGGTECTINFCDVDVCSVTGGPCTADADCPLVPVAGIDTIVQLTNTSDFLTKVYCFYVNANSHCSNAPDTICTEENFRDVCPLGGLCMLGWQETDFRLTLTKRQPLSWSVNNGLSSLPLSSVPGGIPPQYNEGSIPPAPEAPFMGELRCIQVDVTTELPADRNDLKGDATIVTTINSRIDARKYNATGLIAIEGAQDGDPHILNIGGPAREYYGCPNILTLNHFFDDAQVPTHSNTLVGGVTSDLTILPCAADFLNQDLNPATATVQFLIFNEFEQRFSTSEKIVCYEKVQLSDIDTRPGPAGNPYSIFNVNVEGTLTGQTRLRSVQGPDVDGYNAKGIIALLEENWAAGVCGVAETVSIPSAGDLMPMASTVLCTSDADCPDNSGEECLNPGVSTTAANVQVQGTREQGDRIIIPLP